MCPLHKMVHIPGTNQPAGAGWLPCDLVLDKLGVDFRSLLSIKWGDTDQFGI